MAGGGKGGSQSTQVTIPPWLEQAAQRNIAKAEDISQIGFTPYIGPDVAAMTPMQMAAMQGTNQAAQAFGLASADPMAGMPPVYDFGGVRGYSSYPLYSQSLANLQAVAPAQFAALQAPFINPVTGALPSEPYMTGAQLAAANPSNTRAPMSAFEQEALFAGRGGGDY